MKTTIAVAALAACLITPATPVKAVAGFAGSWMQQSRGKELVLVPKIKLQPNVGIGAGTSLGGSVGYGSMTRTAVVTEPTLLDVERTMNLKIAADGGFTWSTVTLHPDGANCVRTTRREKRGRATHRGSTLSFQVAGGTERFEKSCGGSGSSALPASTEQYVLSMAGGRMRLTSGSTTWVFTRG